MLALKTVRQILSEPDYNSHLHKFNLISGRFIIRSESNIEEYIYLWCVKNWWRLVWVSIHHKTCNHGHLELDWNDICSLVFLSFFWIVSLFSCTQPKHKTSETQRENRKCLPSFPPHCQTTNRWRNREDNYLYTKLTKVYFRIFTCQQTVSRRNVYI